MNIYDVHIVRIKDHESETDLSLDVLFAVDHPDYPPIPKKVSWRAMITWIVNIVFSDRIYSEKGVRLTADTPYAVVFPVPFEDDYVILPSFVHSDQVVGLTITDETVNGFTVTPNGGDCTLDFSVIPITPPLT